MECRLKRENEITAHDDEERIPEEYSPGVLVLTTHERGFLLQGVSHARRVVALEVVLEENVKGVVIGWATKSDRLRYHYFHLNRGTFEGANGVTSDMGDGFRKIIAPGTVLRYSYDHQKRRHSIQINDGTPYTTPEEKEDRCCMGPPCIGVTGAFRINKLTLGVDNYPE